MFTLIFFFLTKETWDSWLFRICTLCNILWGHLYKAFNSVLFVHQWSHVYVLMRYRLFPRIWISLPFLEDDFTESSVMLLEFFLISWSPHRYGIHLVNLNLAFLLSCWWLFLDKYRVRAFFHVCCDFPQSCLSSFSAIELISSSASIDLLAYPWASLISPVNPDAHRFPW